MAKPPSSQKPRHNGKPPKPAKPASARTARTSGAKSPKSTKSAKNGGTKPALKSKPQPKANPTPPSKAAKPSKADDQKSRQQAELESKLLHMISEEMAIEEAELTPDASFKEDLNLDEIDVAELLMQSESQFGVHPFNESDWEACATVGEFLVLVGKRVDAKRGRKAGRA
ncbi:MAG: phosphopantetheine-binding protein [Terriglobales bacterium]